MDGVWEREAAFPGARNPSTSNQGPKRTACSGTHTPPLHIRQHKRGLQRATQHSAFAAQHPCSITNFHYPCPELQQGHLRTCSKEARTHTQNTASFLEHNTVQCNAVKRDHTYQHALLALSRLHLCLQALHEHCQSTQLRWTQPAQHHRDVQDLLFAARRPCLAVRLCGAFADA